MNQSQAVESALQHLQRAADTLDLWAEESDPPTPTDYERAAFTAGEWWVGWPPGPNHELWDDDTWIFCIRETGGFTLADAVSQRFTGNWGIYDEGA